MSVGFYLYLNKLSWRCRSKSEYIHFVYEALLYYTVCRKNAFSDPQALLYTANFHVQMLL